MKSAALAGLMTALLTSSCGGSPAGNIKPPPAADGSLTGRAGVIVATNSASFRQHITAVPDPGVIVLFVQPGGSAARSGIRIGDVITAVDKTPSTNSELAVVLLRGKPNATRQLQVVRPGGFHQSFSLRDRLPGNVDLQSLYTPLIESRPDDPVLRYLRASADDPIKNFSRAIADLDRALKADPKFVEALSLRAEIRWQASRLTTTAATKRTQYARAAFQDWSAAVKLDNTNTRALVSVAQAFDQINQTSSAARLANAALRTDGQIPGAYYALGYAKWAGGKSADAAADARRAIELNPFDVRYYELLGSTFRRLGRVDDCRKTLNAIVPLIPSSSDRQNLLKICG